MKSPNFSDQILIFFDEIVDLLTKFYIFYKL